MRAPFTAALALALLSGIPARADQLPGPGTLSENGSKLGVQADGRNSGAGAIVNDAVALRTLPGEVGTAVRAGYGAAGDGGRANFAYSAAACDVADDGACVAAEDGGSWRNVEPSLTPQMFGAMGTSADGQTVQIQAWADAALRLGRVARMPKGGYRVSRLQFRPGAHVEAEAGAVLAPASGATIGIELTPGNYNGSTLHLPAIGTFATCLRLSGASLAEPTLDYLGGCGVGALFTSTGGQALDSIVRARTVFSSTKAVVVACEGTGDTVQGNRFLFNFITDTQKPFTFSGPGCGNDGNSFEGAAVDITVAKGGGWLVGNEQTGDTEVPRATVIVTNWMGGEGFAPSASGGPAQLIAGRFLALKYDVRSTRQWLAANYRQPTTFCVDCDIRFNSTATINGSLTLAAADASATPASFNGGQPVFADSFRAQFTTTADLPAGGSVDAFAWVGFTDVYTTPWTCSANDSLSRIRLAGMAEEASGRLRLRLTNDGPGSVRSGEVTRWRCRRATD